MNHDQFTLPFLDTTSLCGRLRPLRQISTPKSSAHAADELEVETRRSRRDRVPTQTEHCPARRITGSAAIAVLPKSWKARADDNLAAIRLMTTIEAEGRHARPDEQERLAHFTAFGASDLADRLFRRAGDAFAPAWEDLGVELEGLVSRDDLANLKRATQYAHYTPEFMVRAIWRALRRMGFDGGRVLEPGCGTGLFFALCPEALVGKLALTGVEMDPNDRPDRQTPLPERPHPRTRISRRRDCRSSTTSQSAIRRSRTGPCAPTIQPENCACPCMITSSPARSSGCGRGGLAAFVTSRWTMDKVDRKARQHIAAMADLIGAVRLPEGAMHDRAGTEVVVDILFLQKRDAGTAPAGAAWDVLAEAVPAEDGETALSINRYFVEHPEMVLGTHARTSSAYGPAYTLKPVLSTPGALSDLLAQALDRLPRDLFKAAEVEREAGLPCDGPGRHGRRRGGDQGGQLSRP